MAKRDALREAEEKIEKALRDEETGLNLSEFGLLDLPESIGKITSLQNLILVGNQLTTLPEWIDQLTSLQNLDLSGNQLTTLPESIGRLTKLQNLDLSENLLTTLPESIVQLTDLQNLSLDFNQLTTLPEPIGQLTSLQYLNLRTNLLRTLPESIGQLTSLQDLYLKSNQLMTLPETTGRLTSLRILNLSENELSTLPESIGHLTSLQNLSLDFNQLTTLPKSIVQLTSLEDFALSGNQLTALPESIVQLTSLKDLDLSGNQLTTLPESIDRLSNLRFLNLSENELTTLPESIGQLTSLQNLYLEGNKLITLPGSISHLKKLEELLIKENPLNLDLAAVYEQGLDDVMKYLSELSETSIQRVKPRDTETEQPPDLEKPLTETILPLAWVESDAIPVIGSLRDYRPSENDSLDAKEQAGIFATLLIAKEVKPPFALGLFGDWGVGKTFFMRLMQEKIASIAGKDAEAEETSHSVSRAAQIEFNAWHYMDSDLWASLASHIFDGLSEELCGSTEQVEEVRRRLRNEIHSSQKEQREAEAAIIRSQEARQNSAKKLAEMQEQQAYEVAKYDTHRLKRLWEAVLKVKSDPKLPETSDWPDLTALKTKAEETAKRLGITDGIDSAEEVQRVYSSLREIFQRGSGLATAFACYFTGKYKWLSGAIVLALLALVLGWPWILDQVVNFFGASEIDVKKFLAPLMRWVTVIGAAATWAGKNLKSVTSALGYLEKIRDEISEPRVALEEPSEEERTLKSSVEKFNAEIAKERRRIEEADRQITEAQAEIQRINRGGLVYDFIKGRIKDSRYLDRLGLISVIRQDFEKLGSLLGDWRDYGKSTDGEGTSPPEDL